MVAIVLGILKLIGILLLIVLGLVLAVIFSVLFVPVRYRAEGSCYESFQGKVSVSWFLHLISLKASYDGEAHVDFRILWFHPGREKTETEPDGELEKKPEGKMEERVETAEVAGQRKADADQTAEPEQKTEKHRSRLSALVERFCHFWTSWKNRICSIPKKLKKLVKKLRQGKQQWDTIWQFLQNEENKKAFRLAKKQIFGIIRHVLPQKMAGKLKFGLGDPYMTGQVLTWISPFYPLYGRTVQVIPDFWETCLEGELKLKGRIRLATLLLFIFRMLQNKNIRLWIKKWREA